MSQLNSSLTSGISSVGAVSSGQTAPRRAAPWRWLVLASALCMAMGAAAVSAFLWLLSVPTAPDCQRLPSLSPDIDRLYCAQIAASSGNVDDLLAGLSLMSSWEETHPLHAEAQGWMEEWSAAILDIAYKAVRQGDLERGQQLAQQIPVDSPSHEDAVAAMAEWGEVWTWGEDLASQAQAAIEASSWSEVTAIIQALRRSEYRYWRLQQPQALNEQMALEKTAQRQRADVLRIAQPESVEALSQAIALAQQINPDTYAWAQLQPSLNQWGDRLLDKGLEDWYATRLPEAIATGDLVTKIPTLAIDAHDLIILSRSRQRAVSSLVNWEPTVTHLWELNRAIATAKAIAPGSRFYPQAAASVASWEQQLQDLSQLYQARLAADGKQIPAYQAAIASAAGVEAGHLRRLQAQTLVAHWQREVERIEDRPHLQAARQLAKPGGVESLRSAISRANQIQSSRALYSEAQGAIAQWTGQIQTIEDQPILDRARRYANQGRLRQAIQEASNVRSGRALSGEASALRRRWQARLDAAARPSRPSQPDAASRSEAASAASPPQTTKVQSPASVRPVQPAPPAAQPSTQEIAIPVVPRVDESSQPPLFDQQAPDAGLYPSETPTTLTPGAPRFSNEFVDQSGRIAEPADSPQPPPAPPSDRSPAATTSPADAAVPPATADDRRSALPELTPAAGEAALEPQSYLPHLQSAPTLSAALTVAGTAAVAPPERIELLPESSSSVTLSASAFLDDETAFPLLYAGPLFVL